MEPIDWVFAFYGLIVVGWFVEVMRALRGKRPKIHTEGYQPIRGGEPTNPPAGGGSAARKLSKAGENFPMWAWWNSLPDPIRKSALEQVPRSLELRRSSYYPDDPDFAKHEDRDSLMSAVERYCWRHEGQWIQAHFTPEQAQWVIDIYQVGLRWHEPEPQRQPTDYTAPVDSRFWPQVEVSHPISMNFEDRPPHDMLGMAKIVPDPPKKPKRRRKRHIPNWTGGGPRP